MPKALPGSCPAGFRASAGLRWRTDKVVSKLLRDGLIEEIPARGALPIWRRDEEKEAVALRITTRGLAVIGIDEHRALLESEESALRTGLYLQSNQSQPRLNGN